MREKKRFNYNDYTATVTFNQNANQKKLDPNHFYRRRIIGTKVQVYIHERYETTLEKKFGDSIRQCFVIDSNAMP